jgi:hypothetical protein
MLRLASNYASLGLFFFQFWKLLTVLDFLKASGIEKILGQDGMSFRDTVTIRIN